MPSSSYVSYEYSRNTNWKTSGIGNENQTQFGQRQQQSNENIGNNNNKELYKSISIHNSWITMYVGSTWVCMAGKVTGQNVCVWVCVIRMRFVCATMCIFKQCITFPFQQHLQMCGVSGKVFSEYTRNILSINHRFIKCKSNLTTKMRISVCAVTVQCIVCVCVL